MKIEKIKEMMGGNIEWFDTNKDLSEEEFRQFIQDSIRRSESPLKFVHPIEELAEAIQAITKYDRSVNESNACDKEDAWLNLHEELGDVLWAIGYLIESYDLDIELIKKIHRFKMEKQNRDELSRKEK